jgi:DNA-binding transcriptional LysR family regulator
MNLRNLRYFCAAYEVRTTVGAARQCHVTQPVISNAIAQLEEELGTQLFTRQQRGLLPTAAAQRLYRLGGKLLADAEALVETFQDAASHPCLSLRVHPSMNIEHVGRLLRHLRRELTHLEVSVHSDDAGDAVTLGQPVDAELVADTCLPTGHAFVPLWEEQYALVVPPDHPLAIREVVALQDLHGVAFVERTHCELAASWHAGMGALQVVPDVRARVRSEEWALGLVAAGVGMTIAPLRLARRRDDVVVRSDVPELQAAKRRVGLAHPRQAQGTLAEVLRVCEAWVAGGVLAGA